LFITIFRIDSDDRSSNINEEWNMKSIPIEEAQRQIKISMERQIDMQRAKFEAFLQVAKFLLADNKPIDYIILATGLSERQIKSLIE
jgi:hypothetical protein